MKKILIIGIGNSGRQDDGLGWAFLDALDKSELKNCKFEYRYQLQVEDAELITHFETVVFVDASLTKYPQGFSISEVKPIANHSFTSHELAPATVLNLAQTIYQKSPKCWLLEICGEAFELRIGITEFGNENLMKALKYFERADSILKI